MARILVVDDEQEVAMMITRMIKPFGHWVDFVCSIPDALILVQGSVGQPFDLLVTDHDIKESGTCFDFLTRGLSECPDLFPRRVLVMSGFFPDDMDEQMASLCEQGFIPLCMQKPVHLSILIPFVNCLLYLHRVEAAE